MADSCRIIEGLYRVSHLREVALLMEPHSQVAIIPYVLLESGLKVLLITSRGTGRWIIPKGWLNEKMGPTESAKREALEEAGVEGALSDGVIGSYYYTKRLHVFSRVRCQVSVYAMSVTHQHLDWPEKTQRELEWVSQSEAARMVREPQLSELLDNLEISTWAASA